MPGQVSLAVDRHLKNRQPTVNANQYAAHFYSSFEITRL